jgi:hypothetical protein
MEARASGFADPAAFGKTFFAKPPDSGKISTTLVTHRVA